jgi:hypothetical protein
MQYTLSHDLCVSRDDPRGSGGFVVSNNPSKGCELKLEAQNIFAAIKCQVQEALKSQSSSSKQVTNIRLQTTDKDDGIRAHNNRP